MCNKVHGSEDALAWLRYSYPGPRVLVSDPATSYSIPAYTGHYVSAFLDHSSLAVTTTYLRRLEGVEDNSWGRVAEAIGPNAIALMQVGAIVLGHVVGVTLAHERALLSARRARASDQLPLVIVMVCFTIGGLGLLFGF